MEKHVIFVLAILIVAYVGMGGLLFQKVEQANVEHERSNVPQPIATLNLTHIVLQRLEAVMLSIGRNKVAVPTTPSLSSSSSSSSQHQTVPGFFSQPEVSDTTVNDHHQRQPTKQPSTAAALTSSPGQSNNNASSWTRPGRLLAKRRVVRSIECPVPLPQDYERQVQAVALEVAIFVINQVAPRNLRKVPEFNATLNDRSLLILKNPQTFEDWDFYGSMFFAATTITTIGYGHVAPQTDFGKLATVIYALIGIPLVAAFLGGLSDRIRRLAEHLQDRVPVGNRKTPRCAGGCCVCCLALLKIVLVSLIGASVFIGLPSFLFTLMEEKWSYIEALYYSFVTLSTIGFGDYIAARDPSIEGLHWYRLVVVIWIFVGLAWLSSVIALIQAAITTYSTVVADSAVNSKIIQNHPSLIGAFPIDNGTPHKPYTIDAPPDRRRSISGFNYQQQQQQQQQEDSCGSSGEASPSFYRRVPKHHRHHHHQSQPLTSNHHHGHNRRRSPRSNSGNNNRNVAPTSSHPGLVSVAAAATTTQGDKFTVVGVLPQMLQMAMAANAAVGSSDMMTSPSEQGSDDGLNLDGTKMTANRAASKLMPSRSGSALPTRPTTVLTATGRQQRDSSPDHYNALPPIANGKLGGPQRTVVTAVTTTTTTTKIPPSMRQYRIGTDAETAIDDVIDEDNVEYVDEDFPLMSRHSDQFMRSGTGTLASSGVGKTATTASTNASSLLPSFVEDQRFRRTKMAIHSSLSGNGNVNNNNNSTIKPDSSSGTEQIAMGRIRIGERQSHL